MHKMVWNTILIWLFAFGVLAGITFLALIGFKDMLALVIVPINLSVFVLPITCAVCGFKAAHGQTDITTALLIGAAVSVLVLFFITDSFQLWGSNALLCLVPVLATGISFGLGKLIQVTKPINPVLNGGIVALTILVCIISLYLLGAFQSQMAYLALPKELFYIRPDNSITAFHGENDTSENHLLFSDDSNEAFTGEIISYKERLTLDIFTEKACGIGYYIDGFLFGESGDIVKPGYYNSWYGTETYFNEWLYNEKAKSGQTYLLHKTYQKIIEDEFPVGAAVYYMEEPDLRQNYNTSPLPKGVAIYAENNRLIRKEITYHQNGVADWIEVYINSGDGWELNYSIRFDSLGYSKYFYSDDRGKWNEQDFAPVDFDGFKYIQQTFNADKAIDEKPQRMVYVPFPEKWKDGGNLIDNIISVYDFPLTTVSCYIGGKYQDFTQLEPDQGNDFLSLIGRSALVLHFLETDNEVDAFQYDAIRFLITSNDADKSIHLYYMDGKILIEDGPYYLDVLAEHENDSDEDIALRKGLNQRVQDMIEKHIKKQPVEEEEFEIEE